MGILGETFFKFFSEESRTEKCGKNRVQGCSPPLIDEKLFAEKAYRFSRVKALFSDLRDGRGPERS